MKHARTRLKAASLGLAGLLLLATPPLQAGSVIDLTDNNGTVGLMDKILSIQPIRLCTLAGAFCAEPLLGPDYLAQTFARAGIATVLLPTRTLNNSYLHSQAPSIDAFKTTGLQQSSNANTINAWFVQRIQPTDPTLALYGQAWLPGNGVVIDTVLVNGGYLLADGTLAAPRLDTFAHEVGHNLGLDHWPVAAGGNNLLAPGAVRNSPTQVLSPAQRDLIRQSPLLMDAPKVDFTWSTLAGDYNGGITRLDIRFAAGDMAMGVQRIGIDLPDYNNEGQRQLPAWFNTHLDNITSSVDLNNIAVSYGENMATYLPSRNSGDEATYQSTDGQPEIEIFFNDGAFLPGDTLSFEFAVQGNLRGEYAFYDNRQVAGATIDIDYDFGLSTQGTPALDASSFDSRRVSGLRPSVDAPVALGRQLAPGELPAFGELSDHPELLSAVPEPQTWALMLLGLGVVCRQASRTGTRGASAHISS